MNILILTYQGDVAGSTNSISYLAKGLAARGHKVYAGIRKESLLFDILEGSEVIRVPMTFNGRFDTENISQIKQLVKTEGIDIINAQSSYDRYSSVFARWLYRLPVKVVHTRRQVSKSMGGFFQNLVYVKGTDKVIAVSKGVKESLMKGGIPDAHIEVVYNGTPKEKYQHVNANLVEQLKQKYNIQPTDKVIGSVSRLKEQEQILRALKYLPFKVKLIFGGIEKQEGWDDIMAEYEQEHQVFFTGTLSGQEALAHYKIFDINILASTIEGLSQSLLEAMYLKTPVIATNAAGNPDLITHEENGLLFENGNVEQLASEIVRLYEDKALKNRLIDKGFYTASQQFSIENTLNHIEKLFSSLVGRPN